MVSAVADGKVSKADPRGHLANASFADGLRSASDAAVAPLGFDQHQKIQFWQAGLLIAGSTTTSGDSSFAGIQKQLGLDAERAGVLLQQWQEKGLIQLPKADKHSIALTLHGGQVLSAINGEATYWP